MSRRYELFLLFLLLAIAAVLRFLWLDRYPPGWHHDEALMGVMASEVYQGLQRPIFFPAYAGQEPLYIYLAAGVMALMGGNQDILPVRLTSAGLGLATVLAAYLMGKEMFGRRVGLLGAAFLGTSFWQVMSSRNGYRSITQPLLEGLAIYCFWRARRSQSTLWYALAGAALAGTTYTYLGGRSFPVVLVAFGLWSLLCEGRPPAAVRRRLLVLAIAAVIVAAPIYAYWVAHPETYGARMSQVFILNPAVNKGQPLLYIGDSVSKALALFTVRGEMMWRYNLPGRPVFEWALAPAFYLGVAIAVWRAWRRDAASALLLLWMLVMLFPSVLSWDEGGYTLRGMGLVPALYLFPALGISAAMGAAAFAEASGLRRGIDPAAWLRYLREPELLRSAHNRGPGHGVVSQAALGRAGVAVLAMLVVFDAGLTYRDYFLEWSPHFGAAYEGDAHVVAEARYLAAEAHPEREEVFAGSDYRGHPIIAQLAPNVYKQLRWFDGRQSVVYSPWLNRDSLYVLSFTTLPPTIDRYFPPEALVGLERFERGIIPDEPAPPKYVAYRLTPRQVQAQIDKWLADPASVAQRVNFGDEIEVLAAQVPPRIVQGERLSVTVIWRVLRAPRASDNIFFSHLIDEQGVMWAQLDRNGYPTPEWRPGDVVVGRYDLAVPADLPPGKYLVDFGLYDRQSAHRLAVVGATPEQTTAALAAVKVVATAPPSPAAMENRLDRQVGESFKLLGYDLDRRRDGNERAVLDVTLLWSALAKPPEDYTVFVQLLSAEGKLVAQSDAMPAANRFPTAIWEPGDMVADTHRLALDPNLPPGSYRLIAGMYLLRTGERLPVSGGGDFVGLGEVLLPLQ